MSVAPHDAGFFVALVYSRFKCFSIRRLSSIIIELSPKVSVDMIAAR